MSQPLTEKQKRHIRRLKGIMKPFSANPNIVPVKRVRDFMCVMRSDWTPPKPRGKSHVRMSHEARHKVLVHHERREAFFAALVDGTQD